MSSSDKSILDAPDFNGHRRVEESLRASEAHLNALFMQAMVGLSEISLQGQLMRVNAELCRMLGRSQEELLCMSVPEVTCPEDVPRSLEALGRLLETGAPQSIDKRYLRPDGSLVWATSHLSLMRDENDQPFRIIAVTVDMTQRRRDEEAVRQSEERLRLIVESVTQYAIITIDTRGTITSWNTGAQRAFGWTAGEATGQSSEIVFTPEDRAARIPEEEMRRADENGRFEDERWHVRKDGSLFFVSGVLFPLRDEHSQLHGYVKVARDLTRQRQAEEALRNSEERVRIAIEAGELGTWDWDIEHDEIYWNERHFLLFGMTPHAGPVQLSDFAARVHPDDATGVAQRLNIAIEGAGPYKDEFRIVREDNGEVRWMNGYGHTIEARDGRATRMSGMMFDSTERRQVQEVLQRSHEELEKLVEERTHELGQALQQVRAEVEQRRRLEKARANLVKRIVNTQEEERGRISRELHDNLGQHLTAILLSLHALENEIGTLVGGERKDELPQLSKLRQLVNGLMKAGHRQAWELRPAELDSMGLEVALEQYVRDWSERSRIKADFQAVRWQERLDPEVETTLYRVVQEALTNVARHAHATRVSVVLELNKGVAIAVIEDNGRGFDPEQNTGRLGVLGMKERLAIVDGTLEIESSPGEGTTIFARVPVALTRD